jgi:hypothetical protein
VQLEEINLHYESDVQSKLLHDSYEKQAPLDPSALAYPLIQRHGPLIPTIQAALTVVASQLAIKAHFPFKPAVQLDLILLQAA